MKKLPLLTLLGVLLATVAVMPNAMAQDASAMLTVQPDLKGSIYHPNMGLDDTVFLKLKNVSNTPITFKATSPLAFKTKNIMATETSVTLNPNEAKDLSVTFTAPNELFEYTVVDKPGYNIDKRPYGIPSADSNAKYEDMFKAYLEVYPNRSGNLSFSNKALSKDTEVVLTLKNSTSQPLYFVSSVPLGGDTNFKVKPNSELLIGFDFSQLQNEMVEYVVTPNQAENAKSAD